MEIPESSRCPDLLGVIADLERKLVRLQQRRDQLDAQAREVEADLMALRRVQARNLLVAVDTDAPDSDGDRVEHGDIRRAVERAVVVFGGDFTKSEVMPVLAEQNPGMEFDESSVSSALRRMTGEGGLLDEVEKGQGRRQTRYRRKGVAA